MVKVERDKRVFMDKGKPRRLSISECARIQTFPDTYIFKGNTIDKNALIRDAVPPLLAIKVAEVALHSIVEVKCTQSLKES